MRKVFVVAAALVAMASAADARGLGGGASGISPGHSFQTSGPVTGYPGASGYAPGRQMQSNAPVNGHPGASGYAPGKLKR